MKHINNEKGQGLVAYSIILAFALMAGLLSRNSGLLDGASALFVPTEIELARIDHRRTFDVAPASELLETEQLFKKYLDGGNGYNNINWQRGMVRSGWVEAPGHEDDAQIKKIKDLSDEVGAAQWSYLTGAGDNYSKWVSYQKNYKNKNGTPDLLYAVNNPVQDAENAGMYLGDKGLFWTVQVLEQKLLTAHSTSEYKNYSNELVLQYFYSSYTNKYYVIKSYVWLNQGDVANHVALAGFHQQYYKPTGYFVAKRDEEGDIIGGADGFSTLAEAKELFEEVRRSNKDADGHYSVIFAEATTEGALFDISAGDYVIDEVNKKFFPGNRYGKI